MYDFINGLASIAERRGALVARARKGHAGAWEALKTMVTDAGVFSLCAISTPVARQESHFAAHISRAEINGMDFQKNAERNMRIWTETVMTLDMLDDETGATLAEALGMPSPIGVHMLGPAKAHFAAGLLGYTECPCLDRWMMRLLGIDDRIESHDEYRAAIAASPMPNTVAQWVAYLGVPNYEGHTVYFHRQIGGMVTTTAQQVATFAAYQV